MLISASSHFQPEKDRVGAFSVIVKTDNHLQLYLYFTSYIHKSRNSSSNISILFETPLE